MSNIIRPQITHKGSAALLNATGSINKTASITHIVVGDGSYMPEATRETLDHEIQRVSVKESKLIGNQQLHVVAALTNDENLADEYKAGYWVREVGFIIQVKDAGVIEETLFSVYSDPNSERAIAFKAQDSTLLLAFDLKLDSFQLDNIINIDGRGGFTFNSATEMAEGLIELASISETEKGEDDRRAVTPSALKAALGPIQVASDKTQVTIEETANLKVTGSLQVDGDLRIQGKTTYVDTEKHQGDVEFGDSVTDTVTIVGELKGPDEINGQLKINDAVHIEEDLIVKGTIKSEHSSGFFEVDDAMHVAEDLMVSSDAKIEGNLEVTGTYGSGSDLSASGSGTRAFFYPKKSAFRAGHVNGTEWDEVNIGEYSIAMGYQTIASGDHSTATGANTTASGMFSTAIGYQNTASGHYSSAMGYLTTASGSNSTAMGHSTTASGDRSTAMGLSAIASGPYSTAIGYGTIASGSTSTTMGHSTTASGYVSTAMGYSTTATANMSTAMGENTHAIANYSTAMGTTTTASGYASTAIGAYTTAQSFMSVAAGRYNVVSGAEDSWIDTDPLFVVGNGSDSENRSNALTVLKNGDTYIDGSLIITSNLTGVQISTDSLIVKSSIQSEHASGFLEINDAVHITENLNVEGTVNNRDMSADGVKLDTIETSAKDDQLASEVPYDKTNSILSAENVQDAIDEMGGTITGLTTNEVAEGNNLYYTDTKVDARITAQKGQPNGLATLGQDNKIPNSQLPPLAISEVFVVNSESAQLGLAAEQGDIVVRSDLNKSFIHNGDNTGTTSDWQELLTPTDSVLSVNGKAGSVVLSTSDITEGNNLYYTNEKVDVQIAVQKSQPNGLATLDTNQKIPNIQLSSETYDISINGHASTADTANMADTANNANTLAGRSDSYYLDANNLTGIIQTDHLSGNYNIDITSTQVTTDNLVVNQGAIFNDGLIITGAHGSGDDLTVSGEGTRAFFYPKKSAFRAGSVDGDQWDEAHIGDYSVALGEKTTASGYASTAMGYDTTANTHMSTAMGEGTTASGYVSTAMGHLTTASGYASIAMGLDTTASGDSSIAMGISTSASGNFSTVMGLSTVAQSYASVVIGKYNIISDYYSSDAWIDTDPLFVIGNGSDENNRSNALTVLKNGEVQLSSGVGVDQISDDGTFINNSETSLSTERAIKAYIDKRLKKTSVSLAWPTIENQKLQAAGQRSHDWFGCSVAISGDTAIVGAFGREEGTNTGGCAYIYKFENGNWVEKQKLLASDRQNSGAFTYSGASVAIGGDVAVVSAHNEDTGGTDVGSAYVYRLVDEVWIEEAKLQASDKQPGNAFSTSLAISGNRIVVGAIFKNNNRGGAYIFEFENNVWIEKAILDGENTGDLFGNSVAISGDTVVVGAGWESTSGWHSGGVYTFKLKNGQWQKTAKIKASDPQADDSFGASKGIAISNDTMVIGASHKDSAAGAVYIFKLENDVWQEKVKLEASDKASENYFGNSVDISGDVVVVGAYHENSNIGSAYVFSLENDTWVQKAKLQPQGLEIHDVADTFFGGSVAISGDTVVVGSYHDDPASVINAGSAFIFKADLRLVVDD